jgi:hypothetical protein
MWNGDTEADPGAHRLLALAKGGEDDIPIRLFHFAREQ